MNLKLNFNEIYRFLLAGGFAALVNIFSRIIFSNFFSYKLSIIFAFFLGLSTGYLLMRNFVFNLKKNLIFNQIIRFILINILALIQTLFISICFKYLLNIFFWNNGLADLIAHLIGVLFPVLTSYFAHKYYTFK